jgi:hypothetical protein
VPLEGLDLGWRVSGLYRFEDTWIGLAEVPAFEDYESGSGQYPEQALLRLSDRLRAAWVGDRLGVACLLDTAAVLAFNGGRR